MLEIVYLGLFTSFLKAAVSEPIVVPGLAWEGKERAMVGRIAGALVVVLTIWGALSFVGSDPATTSEGEQQAIWAAPTDAEVLGIRAFKKFPLQDHPGRGYGLLKKITTTTAVLPPFRLPRRRSQQQPPLQQLPLRRPQLRLPYD